MKKSLCKERSPGRNSRDGYNTVALISLPLCSCRLNGRKGKQTNTIKGLLCIQSYVEGFYIALLNNPTSPRSNPSKARRVWRKKSVTRLERGHTRALVQVSLIQILSCFPHNELSGTFCVSKINPVASIHATVEH